MSIVIQKFGGTSVATENMRQAAVKRVREALEHGDSPVVVVSAMGRDGDPYATDTLKKMVEKIFPNIPLREVDLIMSCGELISAVVMAATLQRAGIKAAALTGYQAGIVTDGAFSQAQVITCDSSRLREHLEKRVVPVVAGFQGATSDGEINTLGRGGSDTTAVILGAVLQSNQVEIFTDVSGISTADPRILKEARIIPRLTYGEVFQFAYEGARVIHPAAVEVAMKHNLNVLVRSLTEDGPGTLINSLAEPAETDYTVHKGRVVTGIAHTTGIAQIIIEMQNRDLELEMKIFDSLAQNGISIDMISVFPELKIFTIVEDVLERAKVVLEELGIDYRFEKSCAKVSVVGAGMRNIPGVMARVVRSLNEKGVVILQTADSSITISLLIRENDLAMAIKTLHDHFSLGELDETHRVEKKASRQAIQ